MAMLEPSQNSIPKIFMFVTRFANSYSYFEILRLSSFLVVVIIDWFDSEGLRFSTSVTTSQLFDSKFRCLTVTKLYSNHRIVRLALSTATLIFKIFDRFQATFIARFKRFVLATNNPHRLPNPKGST